MDLLLGESAPNATYLGQRLLYTTPPEQSFDPLANRDYPRELGRQARMYLLVWFMTAVAFLIVFLFLALVNRSFVPLELWSYGGGAAALFLILLWFFRPIPVQLSEWKFIVDGKAAVAPTVLEHISWSLKNRGSPIASQRVRRIVQPAGPTRDYLELRDKIFLGFVSSFVYGDDLYIGWSFWLSLSPVRYAWEFIRRLYQALLLHVNGLYISLQYENAMAMREAIHSAVREGVDVAVGCIPAQGHGTIGSDVQIDVTTLTI